MLLGHGPKDLGNATKAEKVFITCLYQGINNNINNWQT
jgi:hypothetical protein